jgi:hypothetical protein
MLGVVFRGHASFAGCHGIHCGDIDVTPGADAGVNLTM